MRACSLWLPALYAAALAAQPALTNSDEVAAAREAIAKLYARLDSAIERGDSDVIASLTLDRAQVGTALQKMSVAEWIKQLKAMLAGGASFTAKSEITAIRLDTAGAVVNILQLSTKTKDGVTESSESTSADTWVRRDGAWKLKESLIVTHRELEAPTDPETVKRVVLQLKRNVVPLTTAEAGAPHDDLAIFGKAVGDARIVALGEATHGTREIFQMKHRLIEYLVKEKGFTVFAIEANWPESQSIDRYIKTGAGNARDGLADMYFWTWQTEEVLAMVEWMRVYNQSAGERSKLSFTSFDMQRYQVALDRVVSYIKKTKPSDLSAVESSYAKLREIGDDGQQNDVRFVDAATAAESVVKLIESRRDALTVASSAGAFREALQAARIVVQAARVRTPAIGNSYRDQMMASNVEWLVKEAFPKEKIVLWAHNGHVSVHKSDLFRPMGSWLREKFGDRIYILGFAMNKGDVRARALENGRMAGLTTSPVPASPAGTGSAVLSAVGLPMFFIDLKSTVNSDTLQAWLSQPHLFRGCGAIWNRDDAANSNMGSATLSRSYDGLIFLEDSHAARGIN